MTRPDWSNEVIRLNNALARIQPTRIIYAGISTEAKKALDAHVPSSMTIEIAGATDIVKKFPDLVRESTGEIHWGDQNIGCGVLLAKRTGKRLLPARGGVAADCVPDSPTGHVVICEARSDPAPVVAANYAYAIGAAFLLIPEPPSDLVDEINETLYTLYGPDSGGSTSNRVKDLRGLIRNLLSGPSIERYSGITFITSGVPYGFAVPDVPTTHLFSYPNLGIPITNAIAGEQEDGPGTRVALLIEPGDLEGSETQLIAKVLSRGGTFTRILNKESAKVYSVARHIELFPYDLLVISCHASEVSGRRLTYKYEDSEGLDRTLVVDKGAGFALIPGSDKVEVHEFDRFVSLDGVPWNDSEKKKGLYIGSAIRDYSTRARKMAPVEATDIPRVVGAMALKMVDHNYLPLLHSIAAENSPIVFCNACASWHQLARWMIFGDARAYLGTLFDVTAVEARVLAEALFTRHRNEPLAFALWQAQREIYNLERRPYILVGPHFVHLRECQVHAPRYLAARMRWSLKAWEDKRDNAATEDVRLNSQRAIEFLNEQLAIFLAEWGQYL